MLHINLWEPCYFTKIPDGPQAYTLNVLWLQEKGAHGRIKMEVNDEGWDATDWIYLAQDRGNWSAVLKTIMNLRVKQGIFLE